MGYRKTWALENVGVSVCHLVNISCHPDLNKEEYTEVIECPECYYKKQVHGDVRAWEIRHSSKSGQRR